MNKIRSSLYVRSAGEQKEFFESVERGWYELHSGLGAVVAENDTFFDSIRKELRNSCFATHSAKSDKSLQQKK
jgi:hypothetical protein